jgi:hypothetical protein
MIAWILDFCTYFDLTSWETPFEIYDSKELKRGFLDHSDFAVSMSNFNFKNELSVKEVQIRLFLGLVKKGRRWFNKEYFLKSVPVDNEWLNSNTKCVRRNLSICFCSCGECFEEDCYEENIFPLIRDYDEKFDLIKFWKNLRFDKEFIIPVKILQAWEKRLGDIKILNRKILDNNNISGTPLKEKSWLSNIPVKRNWLVNFVFNIKSNSLFETIININ